MLSESTYLSSGNYHPRLRSNRDFDLLSVRRIDVFSQFMVFYGQREREREREREVRVRRERDESKVVEC